MLWRKSLLFFCLLAGFLAVLLFSLSILYSNYYGRMRDDEALNTFQMSLPVMPRGTIPLGGGIESLRKSDPDKLINPLPMTKAVIDRGRKGYGFYCVQCHGPRLDGMATVGQSFYPLPANLLDPLVLSQEDGPLFFTISLGYQRHPPLYATVAREDLWAVIRYLRAMAQNKGEGKTLQ
jgi:mono/diheme cytochrome c family protein